MSLKLDTTNNLIVYPDFRVDKVTADSLFWRIHSSNSFFVCDTHQEQQGLSITNSFQEPIILENNSLGSRIFLQQNQHYRIELSYQSPVKLSLGLYQTDQIVPIKFWELEPHQSICNWQDSFNIGKQDCSLPFHIKITIPDTFGQSVLLQQIILQSEQKMEVPLIAVGIVTFNRKSFVSMLLDQIQNLDYPQHKLQVYVVDNASDDQTEEHIKINYPWVNLLKNKKNLGGSGGFNTFFQTLAKLDNPPPYAWLIDDDAQIDRTTLTYLVRALQKKPEVGVAGSVMMDLEQSNFVYEAGGALYKDCFGWNANILCAPAKDLGHIHQQYWEVGYAGAYSFLFRTEILHKVGLWKNYFLHVDDSEWCYRIRHLTGKKIIIVLDSLIWHVLQGARKPFTTLRYYESRNFLNFFSLYYSRKVVVKVITQCILMAIKQLLIKRCDLYKFHLLGIKHFFDGHYGPCVLNRNAVQVSTIKQVIDHYQSKNGSPPESVYLVREINYYVNDGFDYEGVIIQQIRQILPHVSIIEIEARANDNMKQNHFRFMSKINKLIKIFFPTQGIVILPFWNEQIEANNLASLTAVYENRQYSLYWSNRTNLIKTAFTICQRFVSWLYAALLKKYNAAASEVKLFT